MSAHPMTGTILFDAVEAVRANTITFDDWHGNDHLGELTGLLPGVTERRYASAPRASMTSIFELGASAPAGLAAHLALRTAPSVVDHERFIAEPASTHERAQAGPWIEARIAYPVFFGVPESEREEFNNWYEQEHVRMLLDCASWLACRRFVIVGQHPRGWTHLALHYLADARALRSPERTAARSTPWRVQLSTRPWFQGDYRVLHRLA